MDVYDLGGCVEKEENGSMKINKYLAFIVSVIVIVTFIFTAFGNVMLKSAKIDEHEAKIIKLQEKQEALEKTIIRYEERQVQMQNTLEKILNKVEKLK